MRNKMTPNLERQLVSSAHVFAAAVRDVFESALLEKVAGKKLTFSQLKLLYLAARAGGQTIGDAAAFLRVSYAAASKTADKLVRRGLLRRAKTAEDRRASRLTATAAGRRLIAAYEAARRKMAKRFFGPFSARELRETSELLDRLAVAIAGCGAKPGEVCLQCEVFYRADCRFGALSKRECVYRHGRRGVVRPSTEEF
jgi:DNA-binding MarR family transcriptional regulator